MIASIVRQLDGLPLVIELAAGRLSSLGLADLHRRLDRSLDLLGGGRTVADARDETLRSTLQWSYDLLPAQEQRLFRHLAVFPDGVDLATAELVAQDLSMPQPTTAAIAHLVDASMLEGYGELLGYWEQVGNWIQLWTTLRNLAVLLDRLGDEQAAALLHAAADHAPEAPAVSSAPWYAGVTPSSIDAATRAWAASASRRHVLETARHAIDDALAALAASPELGADRRRRR